MSSIQNFGGTGATGPAGPAGPAGPTGPTGPAGTSPLTTKGDIFTHNSTVDDRLPVGSDGQTLKANSATTTGLEWVSEDLTGTGTTIGATTDDIITISLGATPDVYRFTASVKGFDSVTPAGAGYTVLGTFITDGVSATLVGNQDLFEESVALTAADSEWVASGNNAVLRVTGVAGLTIDWEAQCTTL